jgi:hypothetical protein
MNNNISNRSSSDGQPSGRPSPRGGYNPITMEDLQTPAQPSTSDRLFPNLSPSETRWLAAPAFGVIYLVNLGLPQFTPLAVLILLICLLARLNAGQRRVAAVPVGFAGTKLLIALMGSNTLYVLNAPGSPVQTMTSNPYGLPWLPIFFAACLFYLPPQESVTGKFVFGGSILLLTSGLLPGDACLGVFAVLHYSLFFVMACCLAIDLSAMARTSAVSGQPQPAHS